MITCFVIISGILDAACYFGTLCEGESGSITCYGGRKIKVTNANYGRKRFQKCGMGFNTNCGLPSSFETVNLIWLYNFFGFKFSLINLSSNSPFVFPTRSGFILEPIYVLWTAPGFYFQNTSLYKRYHYAKKRSEEIGYFLVSGWKPLCSSSYCTDGRETKPYEEPGSITTRFEKNVAFF